MSLRAPGADPSTRTRDQRIHDTGGTDMLVKGTQAPERWTFPKFCPGIDNPSECARMGH
jgi:hypothetical protein